MLNIIIFGLKYTKFNLKKPGTETVPFFDRPRAVYRSLKNGGTGTRRAVERAQFPNINVNGVKFNEKSYTSLSLSLATVATLTVTRNDFDQLRAIGVIHTSWFWDNHRIMDPG